jgi:1-deoxy-D-xylulose-5-phosphate reductoisomerase
MRRKVSVFGATGSIGQNTLTLIEEQGGAEAFEVIALSGAGNVALLAEQARRVGARIAVTADGRRYGELKAALEGSGIEVAAGLEALADAAAEEADWTMSAIVGAAGLVPSLAAARQGRTLALANKESLVCAGGLLKTLCAGHGTRLLPVDSEHSAIFQALQGERIEEVERLILTASGGPFRTWTRSAMMTATPEQARSHPNWDMGQRISIDSASLFNKALEVIEAHELFGVPPDRIEVVIHPQSVIHSMVGFADGSILAQLGPSDMRGPIGFALNWPERRPLTVERLDFARIGQLDFSPADPERFPSLRIVRAVLSIGGLAGAVFNAAKEVGLDGFIGRRIGFLDMATLVEHVLLELEGEAAQAGVKYDLDTVVALDQEARRLAWAWIDAFTGR